MWDFVKVDSVLHFVTERVWIFKLLFIKSYFTHSQTQHTELAWQGLRCHALRIQTGKYENKGESIPVRRGKNMLGMQRKLRRKRTPFLDLLPRVCFHKSWAPFSLYENLSDDEKTKYLLRADNRVNQK